MEALEAAVEAGWVADLGEVEHEGFHDGLGVEENRPTAVETPEAPGLYGTRLKSREPQSGGQIGRCAAPPGRCVWSAYAEALGAGPGAVAPPGESTRGGTCFPPRATVPMV